MCSIALVSTQATVRVSKRAISNGDKPQDSEGAKVSRNVEVELQNRDWKRMQRRKCWQDHIHVAVY